MKHSYFILQSDNRDYIFMPFDFAMKHGFNKDDYTCVYYDTIHTDETINRILDLLFEKFNIDHPSDYKGRSLSVSDVVYLDDVPYYCDRFGWSEIPKERWK